MGGEGWEGEMLIRYKQTVQIKKQTVKPLVEKDEQYSLSTITNSHLVPDPFESIYELLTLLGVLSGAF